MLLAVLVSFLSGAVESGDAAGPEGPEDPSHDSSAPGAPAPDVVESIPPPAAPPGTNLRRQSLYEGLWPFYTHEEFSILKFVYRSDTEEGVTTRKLFFIPVSRSGP